MIAQLRDQPHASQVDEIAGLEEAIQRQLFGRVLNFRLLALNEGLILLGQASSYHAKQLAQHAIMEATELPILANQIEVLCCEFQRE